MSTTMNRSFVFDERMGAMPCGNESGMRIVWVHCSSMRFLCGDGGDIFSKPEFQTSHQYRFMSGNLVPVIPIEKEVYIGFRCELVCDENNSNHEHVLRLYYHEGDIVAEWVQ